MCYDVKAQKESQLKRAYRKGDEQAINDLLEELIKLSPGDYHHVSGFAHPKLIVYTNVNPNLPTVSQWGLVPFWVKDKNQLLKTWNNTLNARGETIFEKPSFKNSAKKYRCIIPVDGFYEHHHKNGNTYPHYIYKKDGNPLSLAGLWSEWTDKETGEIINTFSIVTTKGNTTMAKLHNNPKASGPRMPVILPEELEDEWLKPIHDELDKKTIQALITPFPDTELSYHSVRRLRGKEAIGNVPEATEHFVYDDLVNEKF